MSSYPPAYQRIYEEYLQQIASLDLGSLQDRLGVELHNNELIVPIFGSPHRISAKGVWNEQGEQPRLALSVVLFKYLLLCPLEVSGGVEWVTYRNFKDAAPFVHGFFTNAERPINLAFGGHVEALARACKSLGGCPFEDAGVSAEVCMILKGLPKVPILLVFHDQDEDFPAQCSILFERRAEKYLDMECLAMLGWALADRLLTTSGMGETLSAQLDP